MNYTQILYLKYIDRKEINMKVTVEFEDGRMGEVYHRVKVGDYITAKFYDNDTWGRSKISGIVKKIVKEEE
jgi:hypothetical protein